MVEGQVEPQEAMRVGAILREQRVQAGLSISEVSQFLRIRQVYLEAIESGRPEVLPGRAYARGFVRTYAGFLGLDAAALVRSFQREAQGAAALSPLDLPSPVAESGTPKGGILLVGAVIALLAYGGWYATSMHRPDVRSFAPAPLDQPVAHRVAEHPTATAERGLVPPSADMTRSPIGAPGKVSPSSVPPPVDQALSNKPASTDARPSSAARVATGAAPQVETLPAQGSPHQAIAEPTPVAPTTTTALAAEPPDGGMISSTTPAARIVLRAKSDSWVEVRDPQANSLLVARLLRAGDVYNVPDKPGLKLVTGNAGGLVVIVDGETAPPLGKEGSVRRGIVLDPDALRRGSEGSGSQ